jgi:hypothetical protein
MKQANPDAILAQFSGRKVSHEHSKAHALSGGILWYGHGSTKFSIGGASQRMQRRRAG